MKHLNETPNTNQEARCVPVRLVREGVSNIKHYE